MMGPLLSPENQTAAIPGGIVQASGTWPRRSRRWYVGVVFAAVAVAVVAVLPSLGFSAWHQVRPSASPPACSAATLVSTRSGPVCGVTGNGQTSYLDVPYAAPPVATLRWQPPQPVTPWTTTYQATQRAPGCVSPGIPPVAVQPGT